MSRIETLTARKVGNKNVATKIRVQERTPMEGELIRITGTVAGRRVSLVERPSFRLDPYEKKWQALKEAGLPVAPTVRTSSSVVEKTRIKTVLVTDMEADGSKLYGQDFFEGNSQSAMNPRFLEITSPEEIQKIEEKGREYVHLANSKGILLPVDPYGAFTLDVRPDGTWDWIILDTDTSESNQRAIARRGNLYAQHNPEGQALLRSDPKNYLKRYLEGENGIGLAASLNTVLGIRNRLMLAA